MDCGRPSVQAQDHPATAGFVAALPEAKPGYWV